MVAFDCLFSLILFARCFREKGILWTVGKHMYSVGKPDASLPKLTMLPSEGNRVTDEYSIQNMILVNTCHM